MTDRFRHKLFVVLAMVGLVCAFVVPRKILDQLPVTYGATFSWPYAASYGYEWQEAYIALLDEVRPQRLRIPVYWNDIEPTQGTFDFSRIDWQLDEAEQRNISVILAIGRKLPRWPECHVPEWAKWQEKAAAHASIMAMVSEVVHRYKNRNAVIAWQIENEPFFRFGECPGLDLTLLAEEAKKVRTLDASRPIIMTESGELSPWIFAAVFADRIGISMYHTVWSAYIGYTSWPLPPEVYLWHAKTIHHYTHNIFVSELQAEPWFYRPVNLTSFEEQKTLFPPEALRRNVFFAKLAGFTEIHLWGVEWWYWMKTQGHPEYWEVAKEIFRPTP